MTELQTAIQSFLAERANIDPSLIQLDTALMSGGLIDSFLSVELVAFIEDRSGVRVPDDYITMENLDSLRAIQGLVERLR